MVKRGHLNVPVIGVAKAGWNLEQLQSARTRTAWRPTAAASTRRIRQALVAAPLRRRRLPRPGDVRSAASCARARQSGRCTISPFRRVCSRPWSSSSAAPAAREAAASWRRSRSATISLPRRRSTARSWPCSPSRPSSASITTSAKSRCRTCSTSASATRSSSRSGTATTSTACRSPWPRASESRAAEASTTRRARSATSSRTTCCR